MPLSVYLLRRGQYANLFAGFSICTADASQEFARDRCDCRFAGDWNRRQLGNLQRSGRAFVAPAAISASGAIGCGVAALAGYRDSARLAVAGGVHRYPEREPLL